MTTMRQSQAPPLPDPKVLRREHTALAQRVAALTASSAHMRSRVARLRFQQKHLVAALRERVGAGDTPAVERVSSPAKHVADPDVATLDVRRGVGGKIVRDGVAREVTAAKESCWGACVTKPILSFGTVLGSSLARPLVL